MFSVLASEVFSGTITLSEPTQDLIWINKTKSYFGKIEQVNLYKSEEILSLGVDKSKCSGKIKEYTKKKIQFICLNLEKYSKDNCFGIIYPDEDLKALTMIYYIE